MARPVAYSEAMTSNPHVLAVHLDSQHRFSKQSAAQIQLVEGHGVQGDAHFGRTVQHRSRVRADPSQPNLRQVHLMHQELFEHLALQGFSVEPGRLGENITTTGIDLLSLPKGAELHIGAQCIIEVTGLRNPCAQIDGLQQGLLKELVGHDAAGNIIRRAGIMGIVLQGGMIQPGDNIKIIYPAGEFQALERV